MTNDNRQMWTDLGIDLERRCALQRLYNLRGKARPVPISGKDAFLVTPVAFYDDVARCTQQVNALCDEKVNDQDY